MSPMLCEDRTKVALGRIRAMSYIAVSPQAAVGTTSASSASTGGKPPELRRAPLRQQVLLFGPDSDDSETESISTAQSSTEEESRAPASPCTALHRHASETVMSPLARPMLQFDQPRENGLKAGVLAREGLKRRVGDMLAGLEGNLETGLEGRGSRSTCARLWRFAAYETGQLPTGNKTSDRGGPRPLASRSAEG